MQFADISSGGDFFKPAEYADYAAILIEVVGFEANRPSGYGPKDTAIVDLTAFKAGASEPDSIAQGVMIQQTILARDLAPLQGKATIQKLEKGTSSKPGQNAPWVWRKPEQAAFDAVVAYATARSEAEAAAAEEAPGF